MAQHPRASSSPSLSYRDAGVDIDAGNRLVERIKPIVAATRRTGVLTGIGGFGGLFELPWGDYRQPVLVSGADGVGTKLKLAIELGRHDTIGVDLVAMCANDVLAAGAEPLFFLDYYAAGRLDVETAATVVEGIAEGCRRAGCALTGGETAEMPGLYAAGDYDLAGFCVGIVEKEALITPERVEIGDALIGLASSGPHANGYSLIRRILSDTRADLGSSVAGRTLAEQLMAPTRIYARAVLALLSRLEVHGIAHITGGGLTENIPRILPPGSRACVDLDSWQRPPIFRWLQQEGGVAEAEMRRAFNCGVGMVLCIAAEHAERACAELAAAGEQAWVLGRIEAGAGAPEVAFSGGGRER